MTVFEIVDAKRQHCGAMARRLRAQHRSAVLSLGGDVHRALVSRFDESPWFRRAWLVDGELVALGGVTGPVIAHSGCVWLAMSDAASRYPVETVKEATRQLACLRETRRELVTSVSVDDEAAMRFAKFLGFEQRDQTHERAMIMVYRKGRA